MNAITNRIHIVREFEFPAPEMSDLPLEITAIYVPEDEEWLVSPSENYLETIEAYFNLAKQNYIRYIDNVIKYNGHELAERWAREERKQTEESAGEDVMQDELDRR